MMTGLLAPGGTGSIQGTEQAVLSTSSSGSGPMRRDIVVTASMGKEGRRTDEDMFEGQG